MRSIKRVFLITVDCLRGDYVGCIGGGESTPYIDKLAKESIVFTRAFSNGPGTNQSFPAILTSTYFIMHGGMRLLPHFTTLAEVLNNKFKTVAFHSNPFLSKNLGWSRGFDEFYDFMDVLQGPSAFVTRQKSRGSWSRLMSFSSAVLRTKRSTTVQRLLKKLYFKLSGLAIPYLEGEELNRHIFKWIEKNKDKKFFLWLHYMDPHYPYIPPEPYLSDFSNREEAFTYNLSVDYKNPSEDDVKIMRSLYLGEVKYVDACIGDFLQYLEDESLLDVSLVLLLADHGHAFMEHGKFGHAYDILYNEVLHVPLILYGLESSKNVKVPVQLLDVPPTIIDMLDLKKPSSFMGKSLMHPIRRDSPVTPLISESARPDLINLKYDTSKKAVSCIVGEWKLIINEMLNSLELYNIRKDFEEKVNLAAIEKKKARELELVIQKHFIAEKLCRMRTLKSTLLT